MCIYSTLYCSAPVSGVHYENYVRDSVLLTEHKKLPFMSERGASCGVDKLSKMRGETGIIVRCTSTVPLEWGDGEENGVRNRDQAMTSPQYLNCTTGISLIGRCATREPSSSIKTGTIPGMSAPRAFASLFSFFCFQPHHFVLLKGLYSYAQSPAGYGLRSERP